MLLCQQGSSLSQPDLLKGALEPQG